MVESPRPGSNERSVFGRSPRTRPTRPSRETEELHLQGAARRRDALVKFENAAVGVMVVPAHQVAVPASTRAIQEESAVSASSCFQDGSHAHVARWGERATRILRATNGVVLRPLPLFANPRRVATVSHLVGSPHSLTGAHFFGHYAGT